MVDICGQLYSGSYRDAWSIGFFNNVKKVKPVKQKGGQ